MDIAYTISIIISFDLYVALITPGSVPRVLGEPVVQASDLVSAVADNKYGVIDRVKFFSLLVFDWFIAIG